MRFAATGAAVTAALALGACGAGSSPHATTLAAPPAATLTSPSTSSAVPIPPSRGHSLPSTASPQDVIRAWADTLRHGQIASAARFFALPSVIANGTPPIELRTRADVRVFNQTLPCGAVLISTSPGPHGLVIAKLRLTERPGPGTCGSGVGQTAETAFRIRNGQIHEWLRLPYSPKGDTPSGTPS